jgi:hypothetical protein
MILEIYVGSAKNGSLHFVERYEPIGFIWARQPFWSDQPNRLLHAWGQRNIELSNLMRPHDDEDDDTEARKVARESIANASPTGTRRATNSAHLLPSLLLVARQTPRMAPNLKFSGLVAICEYIGPKGLDCKRLVSSKPQRYLQVR